MMISFAPLGKVDVSALRKPLYPERKAVEQAKPILQLVASQPTEAVAVKPTMVITKKPTQPQQVRIKKKSSVIKGKASQKTFLTALPVIQAG